MALTITTNGALVFENGTDANGNPENGNADAVDGGATLLSDVDIMKRLVEETHNRTHESVTPPPGSGYSQDEWLALRRGSERWKAELAS